MDTALIIAELEAIRNSSSADAGVTSKLQNLIYESVADAEIHAAALGVDENQIREQLLAANVTLVTTDDAQRAAAALEDWLKSISQ